MVWQKNIKKIKVNRSSKADSQQITDGRNYWSLYNDQYIIYYLITFNTCLINCCALGVENFLDFQQG